MENNLSMAQPNFSAHQEVKQKISSDEESSLDYLEKDLYIFRESLEERQDDPEEAINSLSSIATKVKLILLSGVQISAGIVVSSLSLSVNLMFAGQLNDNLILNGIGLANIMISCLGTYLMQGLNQGFGSLASRAFGMDSEILLVDQVRKGLLTFAIVGAIFCVFIYLQEPILIILGQDEKVSVIAGEYGFSILFGLLCSFLFDFSRNYLNVVGVFGIPVCIQMGQVALQWILCKITVEGMEMGLNGITLSTNLSNFLGLLIIWFAQHKIKPIKIFSEWNMKIVLSNYLDYSKQVISVALPMVFDVLCFEINSILIGSMRNEQAFAAHIILCNVVSIFYAFPVGLGSAVCTFISRAVGQNCPITAKILYKISVMLGGILGIFFFIFFQIYGESVARIFTEDEEVILMFNSVLNIYFFVIVLDNIQCTIQGVVKGSGLADQGLKIFGITYYVIGTPLSCLLAFYFCYGLQGFWTGFCIAIGIVCISLMTLLLRVDWKQLVHSQHEELLGQKQKLEEKAKENHAHYHIHHHHHHHHHSEQNNKEINSLEMKLIIN